MSTSSSLDSSVGANTADIIYEFRIRKEAEAEAAKKAIDNNLRRVMNEIETSVELLRGLKAIAQCIQVSSAKSIDMAAGIIGTAYDFICNYPEFEPVFTREIFKAAEERVIALYLSTHVTSERCKSARLLLADAIKIVKDSHFHICLYGIRKTYQNSESLIGAFGRICRRFRIIYELLHGHTLTPNDYFAISDCDEVIDSIMSFRVQPREGADYYGFYLSQNNYLDIFLNSEPQYIEKIKKSGEYRKQIDKFIAGLLRFYNFEIIETLPLPSCMMLPSPLVPQLPLPSSAYLPLVSIEGYSLPLAADVAYLSAPLLAIPLAAAMISEGTDVLHPRGANLSQLGSKLHFSSDTDGKPDPSGELNSHAKSRSSQIEMELVQPRMEDNY